VKTQKTGFASRIVINPALETDPSRLVVYQTPANPDADPTRPTALLDNLNNRTFVPSVESGIGNGQNALSISTGLTQIIQTQALQASEKTSLKDGQNIVLTAIETKFLSVSGVTTDQELATLTQLQSAYAANARVLAAARDMLSTLLGV